MNIPPTTRFSTLDWAIADPKTCPQIVVPPPGPQSQSYHARCSKYFKGLSGQVKLFPVAFEKGSGCVLEDVDGNRYLDFSSGIYVTTLGHCHPKISEAVAKYAHTLMNAHDFTTPIKTQLVEKLAEVLPGDFRGFQFYDSGTAAVEAGMRVLRAATGHNEMLSAFYDFHGKTYGAVSLAHIRSNVYGRVRMPGAHMVPPARSLSPPLDEARRNPRYRPIPCFLRRIYRKRHRRRRGWFRPRADSRLGRFDHPARRLFPEAPPFFATIRRFC